MVRCCSLRPGAPRRRTAPPANQGVIVSHREAVFLRTMRQGARAEVVQHEESDSRGQVALLTVGVDLTYEFRKGHVAEIGNLFHAVPESLFETHAGLVTCDDDRTFNYG